MQQEEFERKISRVLNSIRQNRYKLEQYLITIQAQQQVIVDDLQRLMDEQLTLQGNITGSLAQFEEKAGTSQGLQGMFYGNPLLKSEIMQKRVVLEQSLQKLRGMGSQVQQKILQAGKSIQDIGRYISPEMIQEERDVEDLLEFLPLARENAILVER
ncbi:MAG TPA: hypothetical protein GXZ24_01350 [Firmicutes bacterium]|jgi:hypothetical protein|nr:hypothetical protein [Bacillota bacterium]